MSIVLVLTLLVLFVTGSSVANIEYVGVGLSWACVDSVQCFGSIGECADSFFNDFSGSIY